MSPEAKNKVVNRLGALHPPEGWHDTHRINRDHGATFMVGCIQQFALHIEGHKVFFHSVNEERGLFKKRERGR